MPRPLILFNRPSTHGLGYDYEEEDPEGPPRPRSAVRPNRRRRATGTRNPLLLDLAAMFAEFIGTFMFLWLSFMGCTCTGRTACMRSDRLTCDILVRCSASGDIHPGS